MRSIADVIVRVRAEFLEMPGLCLTAPQVQRLCGIESTICDLVLAGLVNARFLRVGRDGHYRRLTDGAIVRPATAKAELRVAPRATSA
jgi:hypothetical protein